MDFGRGGLGCSQLALLRVFAVITKVDRAAAAGRKQRIVSRLARLADNGDALLVARDQHTDVVRHLHLQSNGTVSTCPGICCPVGES